MKLVPASMAPLKEFLHFGLTSQDINNVAIPLALKDALTTEYKVALILLAPSFIIYHVDVVAGALGEGGVVASAVARCGDG